MVDEPWPEDWVAEVVEHGAAVLGVESGVIPIEGDRFVAWIRRRIGGDTASLAQDRAAQRAYHVATLGRLPDGTASLTSYIVPGAHLALWLASLQESGRGPQTVLSVEVL